MEHTKSLEVKYIYKLAPIFLILWFLFFAIVVNADSEPLLSDQKITMDIQRQLSLDPSLVGVSVVIRTEYGHVDLSGKTATQSQANKVIQIAQSTTGVKNVTSSNLIITPSKQPIADSIITTKIKASYLHKKLIKNVDINATGIHVETINGVVYLTGTASNAQQIVNAVRIAYSIQGVRNVVAEITLL